MQHITKLGCPRDAHGAKKTTEFKDFTQFLWECPLFLEINLIFKINILKNPTYLKIRVSSKFAESQDLEKPNLFKNNLFKNNLFQ